MAAKESKFCDETLQVLKKQLKCQVCKSGPRPDKVSWYKCLDGHMICQDCESKMDPEPLNGDSDISVKRCHVDAEYQSNNFYLIKIFKGLVDMDNKLKSANGLVDNDNKLKSPVAEKCNQFVMKNPCKLTEALLNMESMQFKCINKSKGCKEILNKEAMILHEPECIQNYRLVACPREHEPMLKMPFHELLDHLTQRHHFYGADKKLAFNEKVMQNIAFYDGAKFETMWLYYASAMFEIDGKTFIHSMREICTRNDVVPKAQIYQWIHFVGSPKEAENYAYTLEYYGIDGRTSTYTGQVISIDEDYESIVSEYSSFNCFMIDFEKFYRQFIGNTRQMKYSIMIRNLKEEVKDENANPEKIESAERSDDSQT